MSRHGDVFVASGRTQSAYTSKPVSSGPTSAIWPPGSVQVCRRRARVGLGLATSGRPASTHPGPALRLGDARPPRVRAGLPRYLRAASGRIPVSTAVIKFEAFDSEPITLCFPAGPSSLPSLPRKCARAPYFVSSLARECSRMHPRLLFSVCATNPVRFLAPGTRRNLAGRAPAVGHVVRVTDHLRITQ